MIRRKQAISLIVGGAVATGAVFVAVGLANPPSSLSLTNVPTPNTKSDGYAPTSKLSPELNQVAVAQGANKLENPSALTSYYGYDNDSLNAAGEPVMVPTATNPTEAHKTEPDKNTYLVFKRGLAGADSHYDYGTHFLFQGHEGGAGGAGYITRVNLDADAAHRVTLMATQDSGGAAIATIDGSTWDPWAQKLIYTTENPNAPTYAQGANLGSPVTDVSGALGRGGYEGIQDDSAGNLWIVEDIGGSNKAGATASRRPNSFVYRYVPRHPGDLANGKLQALQVLNGSGQPITFDSQADFNDPDEVALHTYGNSFQTRWVTVHDTATDGTTPFNANTLAKADQATPFKRPENGVFRPGSDFKQFYFDETGDTNATSSENATAGGWGSVMKLSQSGPSANSGSLSLFYKADGAHSSFDNVTFLSKDVVTFVQDAGDGLHSSLNAFDSGYTLDVTQDYSSPSNQPVRWLAEGRDPSATLDGSATPTGFGKNDGDNEITGALVSDGDPSADGILGAELPDLGDSRWRWFYTQQHGDNTTWEVLPHRHHH